MKTTLSNTQWQHLQALFDRAEQMDKSAADALIASLRQVDALIAETLAAMLSAHRQWQQRTGAAIETLAAAASPSAVGARLGAFTLVKEVGRGGMGTVYLGERADGQVQQQVAIKVLHARNLDDNTRARFQREREILASFDHPGIARLLDVGESEAGEPYYVMEYLRGLPIDAHCDQHRLSIRERLNLFRGICDAVQYAHGKLILHRDIKPSNIIVDAAGVPKLIDFGIAKPMQLLDAVAAEETAAQHRYFSPVNAAPEQIRGESVSVACDVYQLGTLLHELLCGRPIFEWQGSSVSDLERKISAITPDAPSIVAATATDAVVQARSLSNSHALVRATSGDLDAIVQRAVRKEPQLRYASVEQLSQDIERHLQDQPVLGRRGERAYRFSRFIKRNRRAIAVAAAAIVGVAVFTALLFRQVQQTTAERDRAVAASKRAEAVTEFLLETFRTGDPAVAKRVNAPISEALANGAKLLDTELVAEPTVRARVLSVLGEVYQSLGDFDSAERYSSEALAILESISPDDTDALITQMRLSADILSDNSKFDEYQALVVRLRELEAAERPGQPRAWQSRLLEVQAMWQRDLAAACDAGQALIDDLLAASPQDAEAIGSSMAYVSKACRLPNEAAWKKRHSQLEVAIALVSAAKGEDDPLVLAMKMSRASSMRWIGRTEEGISLLRELLAQQQRIYGAESHSAAGTMMVIGSNLNGMHRFSEAVEYLLRAEAIFSRVHGDAPNGDIAAIANNLAIAYGFGKVDPSKELQWRAKAYEVGMIADGPDSPNVASFATDYGTLLRRHGRYEEAEPILRRARKGMAPESAYGFLARLSLAIAVAKQGRIEEARTLLAECDASDPAHHEDPYFKQDIADLRAMLATSGSR